MRPVEGFQTLDGKFFEDKNEAEIHECTYRLSEELQEFTVQLDANIPADAREALIVYGLQFIGENLDLVQRYIKARKAKEHELRESTEASTVSTDGQPAEGMP